MSTREFVQLSIQLATMLACAVACGEIMRRFRQPAVVGEMLGGIIIGPTLLGALAPGAYSALFPDLPNVAIVRDASTKLGMLFFLFYAGLEVNLGDLRVLGKRAALIGGIGTVLPIIAGLGIVYALPRDFWGGAVQPHFFAFALFIGMNLANSANPVIARILMDLGLLDKPIGSLVMTATIVDDLVNWTLFAVVLREISPASAQLSSSLWLSMLLVAALFVVVLGVGRLFGPRALRWLRSHVSWPTGFIAINALLILLVGSASEALGIHAFLGAFLVGVALGGGDEVEKEAHDVVGRFVLSFFAPIYFVSMGMTTNFVTHFDLVLVLLILVVAFVTKIGAVLIGVRMSGMPMGREAWAIGFGLNARGATGIILAGVGRSYGVVDDRIFVAVVIMALVTSLTSGPAIRRLIQ